MKRVLGLVLAGLVGAGTLFSGVGVAHAKEEDQSQNLIANSIDSSTKIEINEENFPDPEFRDNIRDLEFRYWDEDLKMYLTASPGVLDYEELTRARYLYVDNAVSFKGIELLPYLEELRTYNATVDENINIDLSRNENLKKIYFQATKVGTLDLSNNNKLTSIIIENYSNDSLNLNLTNNPLLTELEVTTPAISNINLNNCSLLEKLVLRYVSIDDKTVDLSKNNKLKKIAIVSSNTKEKNLTEKIILGKKDELIELNIANTCISEMDLSDCKNLKDLNFSSNNSEIKSIDLSNLTNLEILTIRKSDVDSLDVSNNKKLKKLHCVSNKLKELDLTNNSDLEELDIHGNQLVCLDLSNNKRINFTKLVTSPSMRIFDNLGKPILLSSLDANLDPDKITNLKGAELSNDKKSFVNITNTEVTYDYITDYKDDVLSVRLIVEPTVSKSDNYPVIVIPGVMGSNLYDSSGKKLWAPNGWVGGQIMDVFTEVSKFTSIAIKDGSVNPYPYENYQYEDQRLSAEGKREYGANDVYKELVNALCNEFNIEKYPNKKVYFFSYDWRISNKENAKKLKDFIDKVTLDNNKVDIVAHSMGGIVTSGYISEYGDNKVNKTITCGTPYEGSSKVLHLALSDTTLASTYTVDEDKPIISEAYSYLKNMLKGGATDLLVLGVGSVTQEYKRKLATIAELSPTEALYNTQKWKKVTEEAYEDALRYTDHNYHMREQILIEKSTNMPYSEFADKLNGIFTNSYTNSTSYVKSINRTLLNRDKSYFIVGTGQKTIVSGTILPDAYNGIDSIVDLKYENYGDGTVPYQSATMLESIPKSRLFEVTTTHGGTAGHDDKMNAPASNGAKQALNYIVGILKSKETTGSETAKGRRYLDIRIACPVEVTIEQNGETLSSVNNLITSFGSIDLIGKAGEIKSVYLEDGVYRLNLNGTDSGTMDLALRWFDENNDQITEKEFLDIPVTASTLMYIDTFQDGTSELMVDTDGDGTIDDTWYSNVGDVGYRIREEEQKQEEQKEEDQRQEEQKQEEQKQEVQPVATQKKASASTAQPVSVVKAAQVTSATAASKTGDTNLTALWITLSAVSAGIVTAMVVAIKKRRVE